MVVRSRSKANWASAQRSSCISLLPENAEYRAANRAKQSPRFDGRTNKDWKHLLFLSVYSSHRYAVDCGGAGLILGSGRAEAALLSKSAYERSATAVPQALDVAKARLTEPLHLLGQRRSHAVEIKKTAAGFD